MSSDSGRWNCNQWHGVDGARGEGVESVRKVDAKPLGLRNEVVIDAPFLEDRGNVGSLVMGHVGLERSRINLSRALDSLAKAGALV